MDKQCKNNVESDGSEEPEFHFNPVNNITHKQNERLNQIKSQFYEQYQQFMSATQLFSVNGIQKKMFLHGITLSDQYIQSLRIDNLKVQNDSNCIEIGLGFFRLKASVIRIAIKGSLLKKKYLGEGAYSVASILNLNNQVYVCKSIAVDSRNLEEMKKIYSEYLITRIAGAIGVGPKMEAVFGYDILIFQDQVHLIMESCLKMSPLSLSSQAEEAMIEKNLKQALKSLHYLKICHGDIKPDNIAFSASLNKFIFIDFGLSRLIEQEIGYKTKTKFFGTFKYASKDMKKSYFIDILTNVDLYHNDTECLKESMKYQFWKMNKFTEQFCSIYDKMNNIQIPSSHLFTLASIHPIFLIKHHLFEGRNEAAFQIVLSQKLLIKCMIKILLEQFYIRRKKMYPFRQDIFQQIRSKLNENPLEACQADYFLSEYLQRYYNREFDGFFFGIRNIVNGEISIQQALKSDHWNDEITIYLNAQPDPFQQEWEKSQFQNRKTLIKNIYSYQHKDSGPGSGFLMMFRCVLLILYENYKKKNKVQFLQMIRNMFIRIDDLPSYLKVGSTLLEIYQKTSIFYQKKTEFYLCLLYYFSYEHQLDRHGYIDDFYESTIEKSMDKSSKNLFFKSFYKNLKDFLFFHNKSINQLLQQLSYANEAQSKDQHSFSDLIILVKLIFTSSQKLQQNELLNKIQNFSIKLIVKKKLCYYRKRRSAIEQFFKEDVYLSHHRSYRELIKHSLDIQITLQLKICEQFLQMYKEDIQIFQSNFWIWISVQILHYQKQKQLFLICTKKYISNFSIKNCKNEESLSNVLLNIFEIVNVLIKFKEGNEYESVLMLKNSLFYVFQQVQKKSLLFNFKEEVLILIKVVKVYLNMLDQDFSIFSNQILTLIEEVGVDKIVVNYNMYPILMMISELWSSNKNIRVQDQISLMAKVCAKKNNFNAFHVISDLTQIHTEILVKKKKFLQAYEFLKQNCQTATKVNRLYLFEQIVWTSHYLVENASPSELVPIVNEICLNNTIQNTSYIKEMSSFFIDVFLKVQALLSLSQKKRFLILSAFGLHNVSWTEHRFLLTQLVYRKFEQLYGFKSARKQRICNRREGVGNKNLKKWVKQVIKKIRKQISHNYARVYIERKLKFLSNV